MGYFRFHRSKQILPGVRLNLAKSGPSVSLGVKGARVNVGPQGVRTTVGVPGSGLSYISRQSSGGKAKASRIASQADPLAFMDAMSSCRETGILHRPTEGQIRPKAPGGAAGFRGSHCRP